MMLRSYNEHSYTAYFVIIIVVFCSLINAVPSHVEDIIVSPNQMTITWTPPAEPNGIIVGYRVQYWELGRRFTAEEVNTTAKYFLYSNFSKCSTA